jgi:hypothetical protein
MHELIGSLLAAGSYDFTGKAIICIGKERKRKERQCTTYMIPHIRKVPELL